MAGIDTVSKWDVDTPALVVDLDLLEQNISHMSQFFRDKGVSWRPHTKGQKIPEIAHLQIAAGAIGITCAKLSEAEVMAPKGIRDILVANQVVGEHKASRLAKLLDIADVMVAVDSLVNAEQLSQAADSRGQRLRVLIEVDNGMGRAGVPPGEPTLRLAKALDKLPGLRLVGLMAWEAHCLGLPPVERQSCCDEAVGRLVATANMCRDAGLPIEIVSCGGTGTFKFTAGIPGVTEIQAGGGIFADVLYESWGIEHPFALTVVSTVTSRPTADRVIVDAGRKALSVDVAMPRPQGVPNVDTVALGAEHGIIRLTESNDTIQVGDKVEWIVGYSDTTVCLHDEMIGVREDQVEVAWQVLGRGKMT